MPESQPISERRLEQLKNMAEAQQEMGQATTLETTIPELVAQIYSLREQSARAEHKVAAAIEDLHNIAAQATGEDDAVTAMAARARQRLRGDPGPGAEAEAEIYELLDRAKTVAEYASRKTEGIREGRYVYDHDQHRFVHIRADGEERTMFRSFEFYFDEQNVALWAFNDAPRTIGLIGELADRLGRNQVNLDRSQAEKQAAVELINDEDLSGEYVHRLDSAGLLEHPVHGAASEPTRDDKDSNSEAVLHLYPLVHEHGDAMISGNPEGLRILKSRLEKALSSASGTGHYIDHGYADGPEMQLFAADGEGYDLSIECRPRGCHDPDWQKRPEPYFVSRRRAREQGMDA